MTTEQYEVAKYSIYELGQVAIEIPHEVRDECYRRNTKIAAEIRKLEKRLAKLNAENAELGAVLKLAEKSI